MQEHAELTFFTSPSQFPKSGEISLGDVWVLARNLKQNSGAVFSNRLSIMFR